MDFEKIDLTKTPLNRAEEWSTLRMPQSFQKGLVSVITPTYNRAIFLPEAIDSVLNQTYRPIELIIIDDGSTDNTARVVDEKLRSIPNDPGFSAVYIRQPNRRQSAARNQGLLHSNGEFIQYLDSDDVIVSHKVSHHVKALSDASLDMVWSDWLVLPTEQVKEQLHKANGKMAGENGKWSVTEELIPWEPWPLLTRRRFVAAHSLWNELALRWDDWEYAVRLLAVNPKRARSRDIACIQREHGSGRHYDFESNPVGIELGIRTCRQARAARLACPYRDTHWDQLIANRYWDVGLEALIRGTDEQALEAFQAAASLGSWMPFRAKALGACAAMKFLGRRPAKLLLSRYLPHMKSEPLAVG